MDQDIYVIIEHLLGQLADVSYVMLAAARVLAKGTGGDVVAVLLGHKAEELARDLSADRVLYIDHPDLADFNPEAYHRVLTELVRENTPRVVLSGHTSIGTDVVSVLSAQLGLPLLTQCYSVRAENGILKYVSQICGGKIMAEGELPSSTTLVTMVPGGFKPEQGRTTELPPISHMTAPVIEDLRISLKQYIEPEEGDVDISKEDILVAVGRGIQRAENIELAEELAEALGGKVCASRPVVDQGWLPTTRLVGKSGKKVKPEIYLALGISGAPEHVEGIVDSKLIIAINTDPSAPIFDVAQYGAEVDLLDLLEVLLEKVEKVKG